ncbi:putative translation initiation factor IF2/IF5 [Helianthus debilis subsp. tardiflorus]
MSIVSHPIGDEGIVLQQQKLQWEGTNHDYEYEEVCSFILGVISPVFVQLLGRVFPILRELAGDRRRTMMRPPQVLREGTKKTILVVKGRFAPKNFEGILRQYVNDYVICNGCKSPDTILSKENRLFFLRCEKVCTFHFKTPFSHPYNPFIQKREYVVNYCSWVGLIHIINVLKYDFEMVYFSTKLV